MAAGRPARRFVGSPVRRFAGSPVCWFVGSPVRRFAVRDLSGSRFRRALRYRLAASAYCRVAA
ncbi:hypothetical protein D0U02_18160 [Burkholderia pseudomallei]|nr:hypothetical protein D0U05_10475 [Burkholderia pseudomallei]RFS58311.1 hypothetical protein D0U01_27830 [Burkholderia pseudomallei]RFS60387.1 hypothetical protein D0U02_18160 [Burkholderia pseudomallei]RFS75655.1 hypothetical protein D0T98_04645 [Burkholderia pseudomallei]